jgi:hypothetical protein
MIRIYLDWNVYSRIKHSNVSPYPELRNILLDENQYLFPFSTAHILDIYESYVKVGWANIQGHIESLSLSNGLLIQKPFGEDIGFYIKPPTETIKVHIQERNSLETFGENINKGNHDVIDYFPETTKFLKEQEEHSKQMDKIISGFQGLLNSFLSSETKETYQKEMNISKGTLLNKNTDPSNYLNENASSKGFKDFKDFNEWGLSNFKQTPDFLDEITSLFVGIDISGYKEDKNSIKSTITDSMHCAFASACDIFIVDDKNTYYKSIETYKLKGIQTKVFRPSNFVEYWNANHFVLKNGMELIDFAFNYSKTNEQLTTLNNENIYYLNHYILDFFNILSTNKTNEHEIKFYKYFGNNYLFLLPQEKEDLLIKINNMFGEPKLITDTWMENGILKSAWIFNELDLIKLTIEDSHAILSFIKCEKA